jgi:hypothetical protein
VPTIEEADRVAQFRDRLVAYANEIVGLDSEQPLLPTIRARLASEEAVLSQEYGAVGRLIARYGGIAAMHQYGMVVSQDVVRDAIQRPDHPGYSDVVRLAIGQLDVVIGAMRRDARPSGISADEIYRYTSPVYWGGRAVALAVWLVTTNRGRLAAIAGAVALAIISGAAQAWFQTIFK